MSHKRKHDAFVGNAEESASSSAAVFAQADAHIANVISSVASSSSSLADSAAIALLRHWNRAAHLATEVARVGATQANTQLDNTALALQNVRYEQRHYEQEIRAAQAVEFDPSPLFLAPVDQLPREVLAAANGDSHAEMLARLAHELAERKRLRARVAELQAECSAQRDANGKLETFLDGLKAKLTGLADTSRPLQQFMQLPNAARSDSERSVTGALPTPLYVLFAAANGYREACDATLGVRVEGDVAAVAPFVADSDKPLAPFPLAVLLMFQLGGAAAGQASSVPIRFAYLPVLNLVTVTVLTADLRAAGIGSQDVLVNLLPDDKGDVSPNPAHHFGAQSRAVKFDAAARPYRWAQCLGGLDFVPLARSPQLDQRASVSAILGMLKERLVARRALATQIKSLKQLRLPDLRADTRVAPVRIHSRITRFVEITAAEFESCVSQSTAAGADEPATAAATTTTTTAVADDAQAMHFFRMTLTRDALQLSAAMSVAPDYPTQAPRVVLWDSTPSAAASLGVQDPELRKLSDPDALKASDAAARSVVPNIELLRAMETELSLVHVGDGAGAADELLARQMRRLAELWEIAQEVAARGDAFGDGGKFCTRAHRGRERRPPFAFSNELQVFTHE